MRVIAALVFLLSLPASAIACSCMPPFATTFLAPSDGSTDVPTNARVWIGGGALSVDYEIDPDDLPNLWLETDAGDLVPSTTTRLLSAWHLVAVITPDVDLAPDTVHVAWLEMNDAEAPVALVEFRTGLDADTEAPAVPTTLKYTVYADSGLPPDGNSCGPTDGVSIEVDSSETLVVSDLLGRATLDTDAVDGDSPDFRVQDEGWIWLTRGGCSNAWPDVAIGDQAEWQLGAFDVAGNFSGGSALETAPITIIEANATQAGCSDGSCSAAGGSSVGLLLLPLVALIRRRT